MSEPHCDKTRRTEQEVLTVRFTDVRPDRVFCTRKWLLCFCSGLGGGGGRAAAEPSSSGRQLPRKRLRVTSRS